MWPASAPRRSRRPSSEETTAGSFALHVHARVLGASARVAHCLQVCGLDHHSPIEDDQIQLDLEGCAKARVGMHVLEVVAQNYRHVDLRLWRRDWCPGGMDWRHLWHGRLILRPQEDLHERSRRCCWRVLPGFQGGFQGGSTSTSCAKASRSSSTR